MNILGRSTEIDSVLIPGCIVLSEYNIRYMSVHNVFGCDRVGVRRADSEALEREAVYPIEVDSVTNVVRALGVSIVLVGN